MSQQKSLRETVAEKGISVAVMQPYFFPYLGYFQLVRAADRFILYDDAQFIKNGWVNRNRIQNSGRILYITVPVTSAGHRNRICEKTISSQQWKKNSVKLLKSLELAYSKAPYFSIVRDLFAESISGEPELIQEILDKSFTLTCNYMGITTPAAKSSSLSTGSTLSGTEKLIDICRQLKADRYINAIGGRHLYQSETFSQAGIDLKFIKTERYSYAQGKGEFIPDLSILDVLMYNSPSEISELLDSYALVD